MKRLLYLLAFLMCHQLSAQNIRYVKAGGNGDGSSWQSASGNLQAMINASDAEDEVWVAMGVYKPVSPIDDPLSTEGDLTSRFSTFTMKSGVKLYGGFPDSGLPSLADRDFDFYETTLSGDIGILDDTSDNCFHVCFFPSTDNAVLDGFTIIDGHANGNASTFDYLIFVTSVNDQISNYNGGGIYIYGGSNEILNCRILDNRSLYGGGGVYSIGGTHAFVNNQFENNFGRADGGALYMYTGEYTLTSNQFLNNQVVLGIGYPFPMPSPGDYASGAGVSSWNASVDFSSNHFENNNASVNSSVKNARGGAICIRSGAHTIHNNTFVDNSATYLPEGVQVCSGGALYIEVADAEIQNCEFFENLSHGSGGAVYLVLGVFEVTGNRFSANHAVGNGGALVCASITAKIVNNVFDSNSNAGNGAAIHSTGNSPEGPNFFVNNTFYNNATSLAQAATGISLDGGVGHVLNCVFYHDTPTSSIEFQFYSASGSTFLHNMYQVGISYPEQGIIGSDGDNNPLFVDAPNGDFSLMAGSPCIGAGSNVHYLETFPEIDFLGNPRIYDGTIDLGAVEYPGTSSAATLSQSTPSIRVYPNPASAEQTVTIEATQRGVYFIFDATGKIVETFTCQAGANTFTLTHPQGIYYIKSSKGEGVKLILQ